MATGPAVKLRRQPTRQGERVDGGAGRAIKFVGASIAILLIAAACSSDDNDSSADDVSPDTDAEQAEMPESEVSSDMGEAVVTLNEEFAFAVASCSTFDGQLSGSTRADDDEMWISFDIPPEDWESNEDSSPPDIAVWDTRQDPDVTWTARYDESVPGSFEYTTEGARATGTAIFTSNDPRGSVDFESETVEGTFDIDCGG